MDMAQQELMRVTQISRAMLGLYRESKAPVEVELREMLQEVLLLMEGRFSNQRVTVTTDMPQPISVAAFPAELRQVFSNLITNAAEAAGAQGHVKVSLCPQAAGVDSSGQKTEAGAVIQIADNGPGIPGDVHAHLFQPFFTTKGELGTGLGLWVSRGIISKHGGAILAHQRHQPKRPRHHRQCVPGHHTLHQRRRRLDHFSCYCEPNDGCECRFCLEKRRRELCFGIHQQENDLEQATIALVLPDYFQ